jgi:hypothetical protein
LEDLSQKIGSSALRAEEKSEASRLCFSTIITPLINSHRMAKNSIQVTTAHISAETQVIVPNCYLISRAVKAQLANDQMRDYLLMLEKDGHPVDNFVKDQLETAGNFLHELIDALEGKEPENK